MKRILLLFLSLQAIVLINAQARAEISELGIFGRNLKGAGQIYCTHPKGFNDIIKTKSRIEKKVKVWRVRIYMGTGNDARETAKSVRAGFVSEYPEIEANTVYPSPYFKVLVGVFKTRLEAESFRTELLNNYPDSRVETGVVVIGSAKE